ncbi:MAG TPA: hypothetical protein PK467_02220 [Candidatus Wallbacteria bacterium]|nr:hypothetical protein [Candidatus Wallbacteria bacterium]
MQITAINKIESYFRRNFLCELIQRMIAPFLALTAFVSAVSFFSRLDYKVWLFLFLALLIKIIYIFFRAASLKIDPKDCYREIDRALALDERAVTYYETRKNSGKPSAARSEELVLLVQEDFFDNYSRKSIVFSDDKMFDEAFKPFRTVPGRNNYLLLGFIAVLSALHIYFDYFAVSTQENAGMAAGEKKESPAQAAKVLDALIAANDEKLKAADAVLELKQAREKLKEPQTARELAKNLRDTAEKLKQIQQGENKKGAQNALDKLGEAANEMVSGKSAEGLSEQDRKMVEERLKEFKKLVDDYLKNSNDKDFAKIEKELAELTALLDAKKEALKKAALEKKDKSPAGEQNAAGGGSKKESTAEEKSAMKHLDRLSGKELLEKLKNDKQLQELYAALSAMSDEADAKSGGQKKDSGQAGAGDKQPGADGGGGKDGKPGTGGKKGKEGGGGITAEALGIDIPKPGKGSSNLKAEAGEAPLMAPQNRQKAGAAEKKAGQWKAFFESERFDVESKKSKVEGLHDASAPSMTIEGKSLPEPGAAGEKIGGIIKSEAAEAESLVSGDRVADELKKPVADYFKKLNNDFGEKP